jgi:hypothetical protein
MLLLIEEYHSKDYVSERGEDISEIHLQNL